MTKQPNSPLLKPLPVILLSVIGLFYTNYITAQSDAVEVVIDTNQFTLGYGDILLISSLTIKETIKSGFGKKEASNDIDTINIINTIDGYKFFSYESLQGYGADMYWPGPQEQEFNNQNIKIKFSTKDTTTIDSIVISNLKLVPMEGNYTYSGGINVLVDTNASGYSSIIKDTIVGEYSMVHPLLDLNYDSSICENQPFTINIEVKDTVTAFSTNDTLVVEYLRSFGNYTDSIIDSIALGPSPPDLHYTFYRDSLYSDYNAIVIKVLYENGWKIEDTINIGDPTADIYRGDTPWLNFIGDAAGNGSVNVSVLINSLNLKNLFDYDVNDSLFIDTSPVYLDDSYVFHPNIAGKGICFVWIKTVSLISGCETVKNLRINVIPDIITLDKTYCYDETANPIDTIEVALTVLEEAYKVKTTNNPDHYDFDFQSTAEFSSLTVEYGGNIIDTLTFADTTNDSNASFLKFAIRPNEIIEKALGHMPDMGEDVDIIFKLNIEVESRFTSYLWIDWVVPAAVVDFIEEGWTCKIQSNGEYNCYYTIENISTTLVNIESELTTIAIPKDDGYLIDYPLVYCQNSEPIRLRSNRTIDTIISSVNSSIFISDKEYTLDFSAFPQDMNTTMSLTLKYYDENTCPGDTTYTPTVYAVPEVDFLADAICEGDDQEFTQVSPDSAWVNIKGWDWNFGDEYTVSNLNDTSIVDIPNNLTTTTGTYKDPVHKYRTPGKKAVRLGVMSEQGCTNYATDTIVIGKYPSPKFTFHGKLENKPTTLTNLSGIFPDDSVREYRYTIVAPSGTTWNYRLPNRNRTSFIPDEFGVYQVNLRATSGNKCMGYADTLIPVFPTERVTNESHYFQDFTQSQNLTGWLPSYSYLKGQEENWKQIPVSGLFNDGDKHKEGNMWLTGAPADSADNEISWLESPCFEIKDLKFPMISMDIFQSVETGRDGAAVFYSVDDGDTWKRLGSKETGANWYNTEGIFSNPGNTIGKNTGFQGWSKDTTAWVIARHPLEFVRNEIPVGGCVRFRIAYNSNDYHNSIYTGFAMDNFLIGKRKRVVLLEQFINSTYENEVPSSPKVDFDKLNSFVDSNAVEVVDIRYHMATDQYEDPLFRTFNNCQDVISRAAEYGADAFGPMWVMDGSAIRSMVWGTPVDIDYNEAFLKRGLVDPAFEIDSVQTKLEGNSLHISARIRKVSAHLDEKLGIHDHKVRFAIVQKSYTDELHKIHRNVLIDLLAEGTDNVAATLTAPFDVGRAVTVTETWTPSIKTAGNDYRLIIYVQGRYNYDQIEQVWFRDLTTKEVPQLSTNLEQSPISGNTLEVYPNPVKQQLNIFIPHNFGKNMKWEVYSMNGQLVHSGQFSDSDGQETIRVDKMKEGVYVLKISNHKGIQLVTKFSKIY